MTEALVLDANIGIALVLDDEAGHVETGAVLEAALGREYATLAPPLYLFEVGNVLARSRGKPERRAERLDAAHALVDVVEVRPPAFHRALAIATDGKLSFYDAAYLALAEQHDATLWTEDKELLKRFPGRTADTKELRRRIG